jgi:hypothetical protein
MKPADLADAPALGLWTLRKSFRFDRRSKLASVRSALRGAILMLMEQLVEFGALRLETDVSAGAWAVAAVSDAGVVGCLVPALFSDYARVFHPAYRRTSDTSDVGPESGEPAVFGVRGGDREVRWAQIANGNGRVAHPAMEWTSITGSWRYHEFSESQPGLWDVAPNEGSLPHRQVVELAKILREHTGTPDHCYFAIWEGFGTSRDVGVAAKLSMPHRDMLLFSGPLSAAGTSFGELFGDGSYLSPSLWWPADRAWCVATDVDLRSSYVGATNAVVNALLADPELEVMRVTADTRLTADADTINPEPAGRSPYE